MALSKQDKKLIKKFRGAGLGGTVAVLVILFFAMGGDAAKKRAAARASADRPFCYSAILYSARCMQELRKVVVGEPTQALIPADLGIAAPTVYSRAMLPAANQTITFKTAGAVAVAP